MRISFHSLALFLILILGFVIRYDFLQAGNFVIDSDEAIVGLMARHYLEGRDMPPFYYGQHYMGSLEPFLTALLFKATGATVLSLKLVPLIFSLYFIYLIYLITLEITERKGAYVAALLCAVAPATLIVWSGKARGGFIEILCLGAIATLFTIRWLQDEQPKNTSLLFIGLILGVGWWVNNQIIYFMLPIGFIALTKVTGVFSFMRLFLLGVSGFAVGSFPFWYYNITNGFLSFSQLSTSQGKGTLSHLYGSFTTSLPILIGAKQYWGSQDTFWESDVVVPLVVGVLFAALLFIRRKDIGALIRLKTGDSSGVELLLLLLFSLTAVFCLSSFGYLSQAPRYLLPFYVAYFPLLGFLYGELSRRLRSFFPTVLIAFVFCIQLLSCYLQGRALPGEPFVYQGQRVSKDHTELITWLAEKKIDYVNTNYWVGYRLAFESGERVRFHTFQIPEQTRIPWYSSGFDRTMPYVLVPAQADHVSTALTLSGYRFNTAERSNYVILYNITRPKLSTTKLSPEKITPVASLHNKKAHLAIDGSLQTRWASHMPQREGMSFRFDFAEGGRLSHLIYRMGNWTHDYPRRLRIELTFVDGEKRVLVRGPDFESLRYTFDDTFYHIALPDKPLQSLVFYQKGRDTAFDWSIPEVEFYVRKTDD